MKDLIKKVKSFLINCVILIGHAIKFLVLNFIFIVILIAKLVENLIVNFINFIANFVKLIVEFAGLIVDFIANFIRESSRIVVFLIGLIPPPSMYVIYQVFIASPTVIEQASLMDFSCEYDNKSKKHYCDYTFISGDKFPLQSCSIIDDAGTTFKEINHNKPRESKKNIPILNPQGHITFDCGKDFKISIPADIPPEEVSQSIDKLQKGIDAYNERNYHKAREIFEPLAKGNAVAQNYLGNLYRYGHGGVPQDYEIAVEWYEKSANQGYRFAQHNLGHRHQFGQGELAEDCSEAEILFEKAWDREEGDRDAKEHLDDLNCEESLY